MKYSSEITQIFKKAKINKSEKQMKKSSIIEIIPAEGNIYVQADVYSGLYILRKIIGIIKCKNNEVAGFNTRFCIVKFPYDDDGFTLNKIALVIVDSYTGAILEGYSMPDKPDVLLLDIIRKILVIDHSNLFYTSIEKLSKLFQINKPYLEN